jgi:hypothetical protein
MNILDLPKEILEHILSYNMFPYCICVCRELNHIETDLMNERLSILIEEDDILLVLSHVSKYGYEAELFSLYYHTNEIYDTSSFLVQLLINKKDDYIFIYKIIHAYLSYGHMCNIYECILVLACLDEIELLRSLITCRNEYIDEHLVKDMIDRGCSADILELVNQVLTI